MRPKTKQLYEHLCNIAAETEEPLGYVHIAAIIDVPRWHLSPVLKSVRQNCLVNDEPDITAFVVSKKTGEVLEGFDGADAASERKAAHEFHRKRKWGV